MKPTDEFTGVYSLKYFQSFATQITGNVKLPKTAKFWKSDLLIPDGDILNGYDYVDIFYTENKGIISKYYFRIAKRINL